METLCAQVLPGLLERLPPPVKALAWVINTFKLDKRMAMKVGYRGGGL